MGAHRGRCFRALRRARNKHKLQRQRKDGHAGGEMTKPKFEAINLLGSFDEYDYPGSQRHEY